MLSETRLRVPPSAALLTPDLPASRDAAVEGATETEDPPVDNTAAALTMAGIFGLVFAFILFIHFQIHGVSCNWLNEGGLPRQRQDALYAKVPAKDPAIVKAMMTNPIAVGKGGPPPPPARPANP
eukprot:scaffold286_cov247-Pinguiococcus_pyrenoidosus.AAC.18